MLTLRHILRARPRLLLWTVLWFAIQALSPAVRPVAHRHAGDDRPHTHVGDTVFAGALYVCLPPFPRPARTVGPC